MDRNPHVAPWSRGMLPHVRKGKACYKLMLVVLHQTTDATCHSTILEWWLVCITFVPLAGLLTRNNLQYPENLQFKQLLADDDEHDVGASSAVGR